MFISLFEQGGQLYKVHCLVPHVVADRLDLGYRDLGSKTIEVAKNYLSGNFSQDQCATLNILHPLHIWEF